MFNNLNQIATKLNAKKSLFFSSDTKNFKEMRETLIKLIDKFEDI